ncbi:MAG: HEAT repeat domain-containing protein [Planctomycetota bacterium]|jgi:hypothetical protein
MRRALPPVCLSLLLCLLAAPAARGGDEALPDDAPSAYRVALRLEAEGERAGARRALEHVLALDPDHAAARRALGYEHVRGVWRRGDEIWRAKGFVHHDGRWMTGEEFAAATRPAREAEAQREGEQRVLRLLAMIGSEDGDRVREARRRMAQEDAGFKLAPLAQALRCRPASLRIFAAEELARLADPLAVPALLVRTVDDPDEAVRTAAARALREIDAPGTVEPLARALWSRHADVRVRAAAALAELGDEHAAGYVIRRWEARSGDFTRVYFAQIEQISYIQDFDVEVASTSFIADPVVGVLQPGLVHDVRILATVHTFTTVERVAYHDALKRLSGRDLGTDVRAWRRWWEESR